ncbi:MAG: competence/damage-inducible protein A [candidate division WOR-3 bacterium]
MPNAYLIIIGDEILSGRTQDTNSYYLAQRLNEIGISVCCIVTIGDNRLTIEETLKNALEMCDIVITSGGLGPTPDDHTIISVANVLKRKLILEESILKKVERYFQQQNQIMSELATKQALIPQGSIILDNPAGQAPGLILKMNKKTLILLPGVSEELQKIFETGVIPYLSENYDLQPPISLIIRTTNLSEMIIVDKISDILKNYRGLSVSYLPSIIGVDIRITNIKDKKTTNNIQKEIYTILKPYVYGFNKDKIEEVIGNLCRKKQLTLSIAESCTGGLISDKITNIAGSSEYFIGGAVLYSNKLKTLIAEVKRETLRKFGAVSQETVLEMAVGIRQKFGTDIGLSVSGIAGPSGATKEKPVGLVYIGIASPKRMKAEKYIFSGNRQMIKIKAAMSALDLLRRTLEEL